MSTALTGTNGTNVPDVLNLTIHNLATPPSSLTPQDLLSQAKTSWLFGKAARAVTVKLFKEIMQRCDGRTKNCPPRLDENGKEQRDEHGSVILMTMKEAFASIGIEYEAARKFVYRDKKTQELEALSLQYGLTDSNKRGEKPLFKAGDIVDAKEFTCAEVARYNETTDVLDVKECFGTGEERRVKAEDVVLLNGLRVVDGEVIVPKVVTLDASVIYLDAATGKKFTYTGDGTLKPTQAETKKEILAAVKEERAEVKAAAELTAKKARDAARKEEAEKKEKALIAQAKGEGKKNKKGKKDQKAARAAVVVRRMGEANEFGLFPESAREFVPATALFQRVPCFEVAGHQLGARHCEYRAYARKSGRRLALCRDEASPQPARDQAAEVGGG
jgi:hypothetical protein